MSKYLVFNDVLFKDQKTLVLALNDIGYSDVETGTAVPLVGYHGDRRKETAEVIVRRKYIGSASNDLGFHKTKDGFVPIISEYDNSSQLGRNFLPKLRTAYNERVVSNVKTKMKGSQKRTVESGLIKIRVRF